jgi:segregation and condensation protein B
MEINKIEGAVEALLFASGEPIPVERMSQVLGVDRNTLIKILTIMSEKRCDDAYGIQIIRLDDSYQMTAKPQFADYIRSALDIKRNTPLSSAAMETLAIIAYNQPVTKGYIEQVRGVDSSGIVSSLCAKGLVEERGRLDVPGKPILYGTTIDFLRCFSLKSLEDLPEISEENEILAESVTD